VKVIRCVFGLALLFGSGLFGQGHKAEQLTPEFQSHMAAAQQAQAAHDYATAEKEYQELLKLDPEFAEIHMNLGLVYQLQDRRSEAVPQFQAALRLKPTLAGANFFLGIDYCKEGNGAAAIPLLQAAAAHQPEQAEIWSWLANAQEMTENFQAELATLNQGLELHPKNVDLLYLLGHAYERLGKQQAADLKKGAPNSVRTELLVAEGYASSNEWPSAVIHFQNALSKDPKLPGVHVELGEVYLHGGKLKLATVEFENELKLDPDNLRALVRRGEARLLSGEIRQGLEDWDQALATDRLQAEQIVGMRETGFGEAALEQLPDAFRPRLEQAATQIKDDTNLAAAFAKDFVASQTGQAATSPQQQPHPSSSCIAGDLRQLLETHNYSRLAGCVSGNAVPQIPIDLRLRVAGALVQVGEYASALKMLDGLPASQKQGPEAAYWRARSFEKLATAAYFRLYQADPNSYRVHELLGDLAAARNDDRKAIEEYRAAVALNGNVPNLHYSLGHLLWKDLNVPDARMELQTELRMNPHHAGALHDLGDSFLLEHHPEQALPYLTVAKEADKENSDIDRDLGTAYVQLKDYNKAEAEYKIALAGDQDGTVHYKLAKVYQLLGKKAEADREFAIYSSMNEESHAKLEQRGQRLAEIERLAE
jgi:tetratricopeptide (TPR) repeat protein